MRTTKIKVHRILICCSALSMAYGNIFAKEFEAQYWIDYDSDHMYTCTVTTGNIEVSIPKDGLSNKAIHQLNMQIKDAEGQWSGVYTSLFTLGQSTELSLLYDIDSKGSYLPLDISDPYINIENLIDGTHHVTILDDAGNIMPANQIFFKNSVIGNNLLLSLESSRSNVRKEIQITPETRDIDIDVSDLEPGIYPINVSLKTANQAQLAGTGSLMNILPIGGERVTSIYYWLNDSVEEKKEITIPEDNMPFVYSADLDMSALSVPTGDYNVELNDQGITVTPNFNLGVAVVSNRGYKTDTVSYYRDNSKAEVVVPPTLQSGIQYDFGQVTPNHVLWAQVPVQKNDHVQFIPRWESTVRWFDGSGTAVDTTFFDNKLVKTEFTSDYTGKYYVQIYDILESSQDFSVKMEYLEGPSTVVPGASTVQYEGIPVEWKSADEWSESEDEISLAVQKITLDVAKGRSAYVPEVSETTSICRINKGNRVTFKVASGYMDRITMCVPDGYNIPNVSVSEGDVIIDRDLNIIVWNGLSNNVELTVKDFYLSDVSDENQFAEIMLEKAYVKIAEVDEDDYTELETIPENFTYTGYNYLKLWNNGSKVGEYTLDGISNISFNEDELAVIHNGVRKTHSINNHLLLTYNYELTGNIVLSDTELRLTKGEAATLTATVLSADAKDKTVIWSSSDESVAMVDGNGKVKAEGVGKAVITASCGNASAECAFKSYPRTGDANWDGAITITDAVDISNYVVKKKNVPDKWDKEEWTEFYNVGANANASEDGRITFADASAAVTLALLQPVATTTKNRIHKAYSASRNSSDALVVGAASAVDNGRIAVPINLDNSREYVALQSDILLPEGMEIEIKARNRTANHSIETMWLDSTHLRVALYNISNKPFAESSDPLLELVASGTISDMEGLILSNILAADSEAKEYALDFRTDAMSGVESVAEDDILITKVAGGIRVFNAIGKRIDIWTLEGKTVSSFIAKDTPQTIHLPVGVYIVRAGYKTIKIIL